MGKDLAAFLAARYDEAEALAKAATPGPWRSWIEGRDHRAGDSFIQTEGDRDLTLNFMPGEYKGKIPEWQADQDHIAACDPAHRLADIALKRAILALHHPAWNDYADGDGIERTSHECAECEPPGTPDNWPCATVRQLGTEFSGHPDYLEEWKP